MMLPLELFPGSTAVVAELPSRDHSTDLSPEDSRSESWSELLVVVVEDSTIVRERLIRLLTSVANVRVVGEAATASDAIRTIAELQPDVVTLDLRLEQGSGLEVLRALGGISPKPCVAVLTNYGDAQSRRECLSLGADYFFDKSLELADLKSVLTQLAAAAQAGIRWRDRDPQ